MASAWSPTRVEVEGHVRVSFAGCNYLALSDHVEVLAALREELGRSGLSAAASRATTGDHAAHRELESEVAAFLGVEEAALVSAGAVASMAALEASSLRFPSATLDPRSHPSLRSAALAAGMEVTAQVRPEEGGGLHLVDGVFPSRGEVAELGDLVLRVGSQGLVVVDDCHGFGVLGPQGRGTASLFDVDRSRVVQIVTLSKAFGAAGALVAGSTEPVRQVRESDAYVGSTALAPALARASTTALRVHCAEPERLDRLREHIHRVRGHLQRLGLGAASCEHPVFALELSTAEAMEALSTAIWDAGFLLPYIQYPDGSDRGVLRGTVTAAHTPDEIDALFDVIQRVG